MLYESLLNILPKDLVGDITKYAIPRTINILDLCESGLIDYEYIDDLRNSDAENRVYLSGYTSHYNKSTQCVKLEFDISETKVFPWKYNEYCILGSIHANDEHTACEFVKNIYLSEASLTILIKSCIEKNFIKLPKLIIERTKFSDYYHSYRDDQDLFEFAIMCINYNRLDLAKTYFESNLYDDHGNDERFTSLFVVNLLPDNQTYTYIRSLCDSYYFDDSEAMYINILYNNHEYETIDIDCLLETYVATSRIRTSPNIKTLIKEYLTIKDISCYHYGIIMKYDTEWFRKYILNGSKQIINKCISHYRDWYIRDSDLNNIIITTLLKKAYKYALETFSMIHKNLSFAELKLIKKLSLWNDHVDYYKPISKCSLYQMVQQICKN